MSAHNTCIYKRMSAWFTTSTWKTERSKIKLSGTSYGSPHNHDITPQCSSHLCCARLNYDMHSLQNQRPLPTHYRNAWFLTDFYFLSKQQWTRLRAKVGVLGEVSARHDMGRRGSMSTSAEQWQQLNSLGSLPFCTLALHSRLGYHLDSWWSSVLGQSATSSHGRHHELPTGLCKRVHLTDLPVLLQAGGGGTLFTAHWTYKLFLRIS